MINAQRIEPGSDTQAAIAELVKEPATAALWKITFEVLHLRAGWALYVDEEGEYAWFFGWEGQGLLVVSVEPWEIHCFHWRKDTDTSVTSARELWEWAKQYEDEEDEAGSKDLIELRRQMREMSDESWLDAK